MNDTCPHSTRPDRDPAKCSLCIFPPGTIECTKLVIVPEPDEAPPTPRDLISIHEASAITRRPWTTIRGWVSTRRLDVVAWRGRAALVRRADVEKLHRESRVRS